MARGGRRFGGSGFDQVHAKVMLDGQGFAEIAVLLFKPATAIGFKQALIEFVLILPLPDVTFFYHRKGIG
jgi:hypothetical protein